MATLAGHTEEVLDVCFDLSGQLVATASADGESRVAQIRLLLHTQTRSTNTFVDVYVASC